jgi:hypothetical protein
LSVCKPNGSPKIERFVQLVADAMGNAGHPPRLKFAPLGPHLYAMDGASIISATFVKEGGKFDVWLSIQRVGATQDLPKLPAGAEWVTTHKEASGQRLVAIRLQCGVRDCGGLLGATFSAIGATALGENAVEGVLPARAGRMKWADELGFFQLTELEPHASYLTIYTSKP